MPGETAAVLEDALGAVYDCGSMASAVTSASADVTSLHVAPVTSRANAAPLLPYICRRPWA